jgi:AcrR family transcriptional regulator
VLIYRHFDSKEQLYREILDQTRELLAEATGALISWDVKSAGTGSGGAGAPGRVPGVLPPRRAGAGLPCPRRRAAGCDEEHHAALSARVVAERPAARLGGRTCLSGCGEAILACLEAGRPRPEQAADTIGAVIGGIIEAIGQLDRTNNQ